MSIGAQAEERALATVTQAVADFRSGRFVIIEGTGGTTVAQAAESVTSESLSLIKRIGNGSTRIAFTPRRAQALNFAAGHGTAMTIDLGAIPELGQIRHIADPMASVVPLPAEATLEDAPEGSACSGAVMLSKLSELLPAALCAPFDPAAWTSLGSELSLVPVEAIEAYPRLRAQSLRPVSEARVPLAGAEDTRLIGFRSADGRVEQFAIVIGDPAAHQPALCRLHSECFTGDLLGSLRCDCGPQLDRAISRMGAEGHGVILYLAHEGRGIGLMNKLRAYRLQDSGLDTVDANQHLGFEADERTWQGAAVMLAHLRIGQIRLLTNKPLKVEALERAGIEVVERIAHAIPANAHNRDYLQTKRLRAGHIMDGAV